MTVLTFNHNGWVVHTSAWTLAADGTSKTHLHYLWWSGGDSGVVYLKLKINIATLIDEIRRRTKDGFADISDLV